MPKPQDLTGKVFGRLTALSPSRTPGGRTAWACTCSCGAGAVVQTSKLISGHTSSCGCYRRDVHNSPLSHGHYTGGQSPTYSTWAGMIARCKCVSNSAYGGKGVTVHPRWVLFENFLADMGERPPGLSLDRVDNAKGYSPDNCRWATRQEQAINRTVTRWFELNGKTQCIAEWARGFGLTYTCLYTRLRRGASIHAALGLTP